MNVFFRDPSRNDSGDNLLGLVIAMFVFALLVPGLLVLLTRSQQLATASPDWDEGVAARAELAELFGSVDPVGQCASPSGGQDAAYRGSCFREERYAGASLVAVSAAELPAASSPVACWLTASDSGTRHRRCIVLEGDTDEPECVNPPPVGPCLRVVSEVTGELVNVDRYGGGRMLVRSWDETDSDSDPDTVPFLPHEWAEPPTDRLIYQDVEWWCLRWRSPDGSGSVTNWTGECPDPTDPAEWDDLEDANWPQSTTPNPTPALPVAAAHLPAPADASGALLNPHTPGHRITDVEVQVCVASTYADRLQGASHCTVDTTRFSVADTDGPTPPTPGFVPDSSVTSGGGVTVTESGAAESFGIRLATAPTATVTITVTLAPPLAGVTVTPATLTVTTADWQVSRTVTVDAFGHDDADRDDESAAITLTAASTDSNYNGPIPPDIAVTVTDDDKPALIVNADSVSTSEGSTADIVVQLQTAPAVEVTVAAASDNTAAATVAPAVLTFAAGTGQTAQTLTISGVDDPDIIHEAATITLTATSVGVGYNGLTETVAVTVIDDETAALIVSPDSVTVAENGTASVDVTLAAQPSDTVTVSIVSADAAAAAASPSSLTFTTGTWNTPQTVTISGTDDPDTNDETTIITLRSDGGGFHGITASVAVTVTDDDMPGLSLSPDSLTVTEGSTVTFDVALAALPTDTVTVTVASADTAAAAVSPATLTFTTGNWNAAQTVTVSGVDDPGFADETTTINLAASGGGYASITASAAITVDDDEVCPAVGTPVADYATADSIVISNRFFSMLAGLSDPASIPILNGSPPNDDGIRAFYQADGTTEFLLTNIHSITINSVSNPRPESGGIRIPALTTDNKLVAVTFVSPAGCTYTLP